MGKFNLYGPSDCLNPDKLSKLLSEIRQSTWKNQLCFSKGRNVIKLIQEYYKIKSNRPIRNPIGGRVLSYLSSVIYQGWRYNWLDTANQSFHVHNGISVIVPMGYMSELGFSQSPQSDHMLWSDLLVLGVLGSSLESIIALIEICLEVLMLPDASDDGLYDAHSYIKSLEGGQWYC